MDDCMTDGMERWKRQIVEAMTYGQDLHEHANIEIVGAVAAELAVELPRRTDRDFGLVILAIARRSLVLGHRPNDPIAYAHDVIDFCMPYRKQHENIENDPVYGKTKEPEAHFAAALTHDFLKEKRFN